MSIEVVDAEERSRFEVVVDGVVGGFAEYIVEGDRLTLTHTEVASEFEGQGVGSALARGTLDAMRRRDGEVVVRCPFLRDWIARHPDYADLLES